MINDTNQPYCPQQTTADDLRSELNAITEVRHGQIAVYPQDAMRRLLKPDTAVPRWRRLLRRLRLMK